MRKSDVIWLVAWILFWLSLVVTFLVDYTGVIETTNLGYVEEIWIGWIMWTVGLGIILAVLTRFVVKE